MDPRVHLDQIKQSWQPPKELECARPREVGLTLAGKTIAGMAITTLLGGLIGGLILFVNASRDNEMRGRILNSGLDVRGEISRCWTSGSDPVRYWVEYVYHVEGQAYLGRLSTRRNYWLDLQRTGTLKVRYLPEDPQQHLAVGYEPDVYPLAVFAIVAGVLFLVEWLFIRILVMQRRLLAEGRPAPAMVTKIGRTADHGKKIVHYVFKDLGGRLIDGKSGPQRNPPAIGSILNVIYEPDNEKHNRIYPLALVKTKMD
jgi:hypothetical protein